MSAGANKIRRVSVWQKRLPLAKPYFLHGGRLKFEALDSTLVCVETQGGIAGWGESCPWGHSYLPAHGGGVRAALALLAPALLGANAAALEANNRKMDSALPGHLSAKAALDMACWDILGIAANMPLWQLLGAARAEAVEVNSSISTATPEEMLANINAAAGQGIKTHSAKIGGNSAAADIARINAIEAGKPAGHSITYDINRAWLPGVALQTLNAVSFRGWVEQPCETLAQCAQVAAGAPQPLVLDECLHTPQDHFDAWRFGACAAIKLKPNRVGGITKARQLRDFAVAVGWQIHTEDVGGSVLADTAAMHLAASVPAENRLPSWLCHLHLAEDIAPAQGARNQNGKTAPPSTPGIGVKLDAQALGKPVAVYE